MLRTALIGLLSALCAVATISVLVVLTDERGSYEPEQVSAALAAQGLEVFEVSEDEETSALLPPDGSFTVLVLDSDQAARDAFAPYESDRDSDTFELLTGNVIILADGSNRDTPLPEATRIKIRQAVERLTR